ncbi:MAG TPA: hydrogenase maturation protease [Anaerolineales bacterium]|nr:hydrogenase maturation protease [Anaerolineales bacterium]
MPEGDLLSQLQRCTQGKRVLIVGVGNRLRGDDALGGILVERLAGKTRATLIDAGDVPENYLGVIRMAQPELIIFVDAAEIGGQPGDIALVGAEEMLPANGWTHSAGLDLTVTYLRSELMVVDIFLLAVQPGTTAFGDDLSPPVRSALLHLENLISRLV